MYRALLEDEDEDFTGFDFGDGYVAMSIIIILWFTYRVVIIGVMIRVQI